MHFGYDALINAQRQLITDGYKHTVLLADNHAMLTHNYSWEEIDQRCTYYGIYLRHFCKLDCIVKRGSSFQSRADYTDLLYSSLQSIPLNKAKNSLAQASKRSGLSSLKVASYVYGIMQAIDGIYLGSDLIFAERIQEKIYNLTQELDQMIDHNDNYNLNSIQKKIQLGLAQDYRYIESSHDTKGLPLNQSNSSTRITLHESKESLRWKIQKMFAPPANQTMPEGRINALHEFFKHSVFPWVKDVQIQSVNGEILKINDYEQYKELYASDIIHPSDCKNTLFNVLMSRIEEFNTIIGAGLCQWVDLDIVRANNKRKAILKEEII